MNKRIAIDMDQVIADTLVSLLDYYNKQYDDCLTEKDLYGKKLREVAKCGIQVQELYKIPKFFKELKVMEHSQEVIRELSKHYEIFITTAAMEVPTSFTEKYEWLNEHFPFIPDSHIVFCGDKSIIHADYLIDDSPRHFTRFKGQGILYTAPHNLHVTGYTRVNSWKDVADMFLQSTL
ncbi:5'-3'-deoxyribonucleotidase [Fodinisporobacter ferrooxydans]|uniref:5'-3'-deoxyribonucleotidase n=1 Tax=Fodinisporobacter ferrooxydans TaxID=2901836 RepID=A0ABY4CQ22_9BACL|nr:5'-3'-deoxyribonucleotidase [Alicyclobacillaceae bacterium MYW30-H2]